MTCHREGELHRRGQCVRCALRHDLTALMVNGAADPAAMTSIVEIFCGPTCLKASSPGNAPPKSKPY
jgi:hypothetical protein